MSALAWDTVPMHDFIKNFLIIMGSGILMTEKHKTVEYGKYGYFFLIPFFVVFLVFQLYPLLYTFYESFDVMETVKNLDNIESGKTGGRPVAGAKNDIIQIKHSFGLGNYTKFVFVKDSNFWQAMAITVVLWLLNFVPQILLSLLLASWFTDAHNKLKGTGAYKVIMYMPNIITAACIAFLFNALFFSSGILTKMFKDLGVKFQNEGGPLRAGWWSLFIIAFIQFWMWYGNTMIVLIAGIMGISPSLYEAAMVDGATSRQQFFKITLPLLRPILQYTMVTSAIGGLQMYDIPQMLNGNQRPTARLNGKAITECTDTIIIKIKKYIYGTAQNRGRAAAYSVVLFAVTLCVSMIFYKLTDDKKNKN